MNILSRFRQRRIGRTEKAAIILLSVLILSLAVFRLQRRYRFAVQTDYSVHFLLGITDKMDRIPRKGGGEYFAFKFLAAPGDARYGWDFVKTLGCNEGEFLETRGREFFCNGISIGRAKEYTKKGKPLTPFYYRGTVPQGQYFAVGETKDSYDSKYWGFVRKEWIIGKVYKLL